MTVFTGTPRAGVRRRERYRPRALARDRSDVDVLRAFRAAGAPVLLQGPPGAGKTALAEAAFTDELATVSGHADLETADLVGSWVPRPDGGYRWFDGPLVRAMRSGGVLFVDDATLIPTGVIARLYPLLDGRGELLLTEHDGELVAAAAGFYVLAAHNPGVPGAVLSESLRSRLVVTIEVRTDLGLAHELGVPAPAIRAAAVLHERRASGVVSWAPEMRDLLAFRDVARAVDEQFAAGNLLAAAPVDSRDHLLEVLALSYPSVGVPTVRQTP